MLALFALGAGFINAGMFNLHWLSEFLNQVAPEFDPTAPLIASVVAVAGIGLGYAVYRNAFQRSTDTDPLARALGPIWTVLENKFYVDELYDRTIIALTYGAGALLSWIDRKIVDRVVNLTGLVTLFIGRVNFIIDDFSLNTVTDAAGEGTITIGDGVRQSATGKIQDYGLYIFGGVVVLALIFLYAF